MHKFRTRPLCNWRVRDYFIWPLTLALAVLVARNYVQRMKGLAPDEWYWADKLLMRCGWVVSHTPPR